MRIFEKAWARTFLIAVFCAALIVGGVLWGELPSAEAVGGSYSLNFAAADPPEYIPPIPYPSGFPVLPTGRAAGSSLIPGAEFATKVESLQPPEMALGQIVPFFLEIAVTGSTSPENGQIRFIASWDTETNSGKDFGYDETLGVIAAFVDTSESTDPGGNATVSNVSWVWDTTGVEQIIGTIDVDGLDTGDVVIVEIWVVLEDTVPGDVNSGVSAALEEAETRPDSGTPEAISQGSGQQTVNLLQAKDFLDADADLSITKSDDPDPVLAGAELTYSIVVENLGPAIANGVTIADVLDPNTTFVSATPDNGGSCNAATGGFECDLGSIVPGAENAVTIPVVVTVSFDAPQDGDGGDTCSATSDLQNNVTVTAITSDSVSGNNSDCEPTDVDGVLPVTIGYFVSNANGDGTVTFTWQTATETGNAGFNLYAETENGLVQLNDELIPSTVIDAVEPTGYQYTAATDATVFYIEDVTIDGLTDMHGPFGLGIQVGSYVEADPVAPDGYDVYLPMLVNR